jgi:hypothetical protein
MDATVYVRSELSFGVSVTGSVSSQVSRNTYVDYRRNSEPKRSIAKSRALR